MTVKELIQRLVAFPEDAIVCASVELGSAAIVDCEYAVGQFLITDGDFGVKDADGPFVILTTVI